MNAEGKSDRCFAYRRGIALDPTIRSALEAGLAAAARIEDVRRHLEEAGRGTGDLRFRPFIFAFGYTLAGPRSDRRDRAGGPFVPMLAGETEDGNPWQFPPPLDEIDEADVAAWEEAFSEVADPIATARLGDLLWCLRVGDRPDQFARAACDALCALAAREEPSAVERSQYLSRAVELARSVADDDRVAAVAAQTHSFASDELASASEGPGAVLTAARSLLDAPAEVRGDLDALLVAIDEKHGSDPYIADDVAGLRSRLLPADEQDELRREQVSRWRAEAANGDTMMRVSRLERALELARDFGLTEAASEVRQELSQIRPEDLNLSRISTDLDLPKEELDRFMSLFRDAGSWQRGLLILAAQPPPGGTEAELEEHVEDLMATTPLQFLMTKVVVGPDNATAIFTARTPEAHKRLALSEQRGFAARLWSIFAADALDEVHRTFGTPSRAELTQFFKSELVDEEVAERFAASLEAYWRGDFDESAHLIIPRIERVVRDLARRAGIPIVREQIGERLGGVESLGPLLRDLSGVISDRAWHAYLIVVLVDPLGPNLRNVICHGLIDRAGRHDAALLIQIAIQLGMLEVGERPESERSDRSPEDG